ncbi:HAD family hydrolase [Antarcticirhabdus aurantiaca]|uniref:HAD family hydrolase n=1 Tax=Antarcticirhabdus aurantiaca TaxID=2606717 RepID=A0ACD4NKV6_9HYPH|nr:HAD family hydrolase [Antarcticirhabdus aurantiaca]WAJ27489.1 HAD family hydrolase [Jeongeuplla avenae]
MTRRVTTVGFDADDTLWQNQTHFDAAEERFVAALERHAPADLVATRLHAAERRNLPLYGFGVKGFILSMIETAVEILGERTPHALVAELLATGRSMLDHPVELLPHAREAVEALRGAGGVRLLLVTKGDLFHQERKLEASGLADLFDGVEIVSDKTARTYARIFTAHGDGAERALMVGNSLKSDVLPALEAGAFAVHVPHERLWAFEAAEEPTGHARFRLIPDLGHLPGILAEIG